MFDRFIGTCQENDYEAWSSDEGVTKVDIPMCEIVLGWVVLIVVDEGDLRQVPGDQDQVHDVSGRESSEVVEGWGLELRARHDDQVGERASQP